MSSATIAADSEGGPDDELLDVSLCWKQETLDNVKLGEELSIKQCKQAQRLIEEFSPVFINVPGETDLIKSSR